MTRIHLVNPDGGPGYQGNLIGRLIARYPQTTQVLLVLAAVLIVSGVMFAPSCEGAEQEKRVSLASDAVPLFLAAGADYGSTRYALGAPGVREGNPLPWAQSDATRIATKGVVAVGSTAIVRTLRAKRKHKAANVVKWSLVVLQFGAAGWNVSLGIRERRGR